MKNKIELYPTQSKMSLPIIKRLFKKMTAGIKFNGIKVEGNFISDGHHRYIASLLSDFSLERIPANISSSADLIDWESVDIEEEDWDTPAKIKILNEKDAAYNEISIEKITDLLK
ncbi:MAG: hypothetical protein FGM46_09330 [Ferruginibacter sp.]|nr:hypothetical protein [Ferruginibacter sp.]